eukprot:GHRR01029944.1.p1 GENE.GHRR01029944.1~~GHRR01029944.1.p1  ORF type:complete len:146 (+),score=29.16 GHRR01029944.1:314-751(+)
MAFMFSIVWTAIQLFFSNYFILFTEVKLYGITFLRWLSALYYAFEGIMITEFGGMTYKCSEGLDQGSINTIRSLLPNSKFLNIPVVVNNLKDPGADCIADTNAVLAYYGFRRPFGHTFGILFGYLCIAHLCTYTAMLLVARRERR